MANTVLIGMPERFAAGTTLEYSKSFSTYRGSDGWTFKLYLAGPSITNVNGTETSPGIWAFQIDAPTSTALIPGIYRWVERATKAGGAEVVDVASQLVTVTLNLATAAAGATMTFEEKQLVVIETAIETRIAGGTLESYQIAGRAGSRWAMEELLKYRDQLKAKIAAMKNGGRVGRQHLIEFRRPS